MQGLNVVLGKQKVGRNVSFINLQSSSYSADTQLLEALLEFILE